MFNKVVYFISSCTLWAKRVRERGSGRKWREGRRSRHRKRISFVWSSSSSALFSFSPSVLETSSVGQRSIVAEMWEYYNTLSLSSHITHWKKGKTLPNLYRKSFFDVFRPKGSLPLLPYLINPPPLPFFFSLLLCLSVCLSVWPPFFSVPQEVIWSSPKHFTKTITTSLYTR